MKVIIDTNSLVSLVRYYLPFDPQSVLFSFFRDKIQAGEIILLDKVIDECKFFSKGIVMSSLNYLTDKEFIKQYHPITSTGSLLPPVPGRFHNLMDNNFAIPAMKKRLNDVEFESQKSAYLESADAKLVIYCLDHFKNFPLEPIILVTEETETSNDKKLFQKIPTICRHFSIDVKTLPDLLNLYKNEINLEFK